jgi:hypothetical protein
MILTVNAARGFPYLTIGSRDEGDLALLFLGETGLTLPSSQRPSAELTALLSGAVIPGNRRTSESTPTIKCLIHLDRPAKSTRDGDEG